MSRAHPGRRIVESDGLHHLEGFSPGGGGFREEMMENLMKLMAHLTPSENKAWLHVYTKFMTLSGKTFLQQSLGNVAGFNNQAPITRWPFQIKSCE